MLKSILTKILFAFLSCQCICTYGQSVVAIKSGDIEPYAQAFEGFKSMYKGRITELIISKHLDNNRDVIDIVKSEKPDIVVAIGIDALLFAKEKTNDIPIVYCMVMDPEKYAIADTNNNITGITIRLSTKDQMLKFKAVIPKLKKLGIIYNQNNTGYLVKEADGIAKSLGIELVTAKVRSQKSVPKALRKLTGKIDALWLIADASVITRDSFNFIILHTLENNIPLMAYSKAFVQAGALMSLSVDYKEIGMQTAKLVNDIVNKKITQLEPIVEPEHAHLIINSKTAKTIGLTIPKEVIDSSDKVF